METIQQTTHIIFDYIFALHAAIKSYEQSQGQQLAGNRKGRQHDVDNLKRLIFQAIGLDEASLQQAMHEPDFVITFNKEEAVKMPINAIGLRQQILDYLSHISTGFLGRSRLRADILKVIENPIFAWEKLYTAERKEWESLVKSLETQFRREKLNLIKLLRAKEEGSDDITNIYDSDSSYLLTAAMNTPRQSNQFFRNSSENKQDSQSTISAFNKNSPPDNENQLEKTAGETQEKLNI